VNFRMNSAIGTVATIAAIEPMISALLSMDWLQWTLLGWADAAASVE
jgi:hypothetical protein